MTEYDINIPFEKVKDILKRSIDETKNMNEAIEMTLQHIYIKGWNDAWESKWIPVNERLPKKSGRYLCTFGGNHLVGSDHFTTLKDAKEMFDEVEPEYVGWDSKNVIAWMPLPESYKAESEEI